MAGLGETLRNERLKKELSLEQVSRRTNLNPKILNAMENENFEDVPGKFYIKNFLKSYLDAIEVDAERFFKEHEELIGSLYSDTPRTPLIHYNKLRYSRFKRKNLFLTFFLLLIFIVAIFCFFYSSRSNFFGMLNSTTNESSLHLTEPELIPTLAHQVLPGLDNPAFDPDFSPITLKMAFREECWIEVFRGGRRYFEKVFSPGETGEIKGYRLDITMGNPAGVDIYLNGRELTQYKEQNKPLKIRLDPLEAGREYPE